MSLLVPAGLDASSGTSRGWLTAAMSLLWLTMLGHVIAKLCSLPVLLVAGVVVFGGDPNLDANAVAGAALLGLMIAGGAILVRVGNIETRSPAANILLFASPVLALGLLSMIGITLARIGLFAAGAALVLATNIAAQCISQRQSARATALPPAPMS